MAYENFYGLQEHFWGLRCILCGEIVDQLILGNRQWTKKKGEDTGRRREPITQEDTPKRVR
jgi:hypothetical protein